MTTFAAPMAYRVCSKCRQVKPIDAYYRRGDGTVFASCKNCSRGTVHAHDKEHGNTVYGREYDTTPIPMLDAFPSAMVEEAILTVMSPADLDAWISEHARLEAPKPVTVTKNAPGRGQTSRLTEEQIDYIRNHADDMPRKDLGAMFGCTGQHIGNIIAGRRGRKPAQVVAQ